MVTQDFYLDNSTEFGSEEYNYTFINSSCIAGNFLDYRDSSTTPTSMAIFARVIQTLYGFSLVIIGALLNALVLFLVARHKKLRTVSFGIAFQLATVNLLSSIGYGIPTVINHLAGFWILGYDFCIVSGFILYFLINVRILLIFLFAIDRFSYVFIPFSYPKHNGKVIIIMSVLAWSLGISFNILNLPSAFDCYSFKEDTMTCAINTECNTTNCSIIFYIFFTVIIIPAILISIGLFAALYYKGKMIRKQDLKMGISSSLITEQEWRAMKTFILLFLAIFIETIPPFILLPAAELLERGSVAKVLVKLLGIDLLIALVMTDPIIILKNPDFKKFIKVKFWRNH